MNNPHDITTDDDAEGGPGFPRWLTWALLGALALLVIGYGAVFLYAKVINDSPDELGRGDLDAALARGESAETVEPTDTAVPVDTTAPTATMLPSDTAAPSTEAPASSGAQFCMSESLTAMSSRVGAGSAAPRDAKMPANFGNTQMSRPTVTAMIITSITAG